MARTDVAARTVSLPTGRVRYAAAGSDDAPPVVLLHGGGVDAAAFSWKRAIPALADDFRVYAPDWPGYGESGPPTRRPTVEYYVDVLGDFLDELDLPAASLVGISMGGGVALGYALSHPARVRRLVLVDSYGLGGAVPGGPLSAALAGTPGAISAVWKLLRRSRRLTALAVRAAVDPRNLTPELVDDAHAEVGRPDAGRAWAAFQRAEVGRHGLRTNYLDRLPDLAVPTLLVHGERDAFVPVEWATRAAALIPDGEVRVLADCGHVPPRERPEAFVAAVREFLADDGTTE